MHWTHFVLLAVCAFALWQRVPAITRVAAVFLANAAIVTAWALFVNPVIDPMLQLGVDAVSAAIVLQDPADREQGWIGFIFGIRIGASAGFLWHGVPEAAQDYWQMMNLTAQAMMVALLLWSEGHGGQISRFVRRFLGDNTGYPALSGIDK